MTVLDEENSSAGAFANLRQDLKIIKGDGSLGGSADEGRVPLLRLDGIFHLYFYGRFTGQALNLDSVLLRFASHAGILETYHHDILWGGALRELLRIRAGALLTDDMKKEGVASELCPASLARTPTQVADVSGIYPCALEGFDASN